MYLGYRMVYFLKLCKFLLPLFTYVMNHSFLLNEPNISSIFIFAVSIIDRDVGKYYSSFCALNKSVSNATSAET